MDAIRDAIRTGRLVPGTRLPSSRALSADLGVARNTVARAYAELIAEGWLTAQHGSSTLVSQRAPRSSDPSPHRPRDRRRADWTTTCGRAIQTFVVPADRVEPCGHPRAEGRHRSRRSATPTRTAARNFASALAEYLARARGVRAQAVQHHRVHRGGRRTEPGRRCSCRRRGRRRGRRGVRPAAQRATITRAGLRCPPLTVDARWRRRRGARWRCQTWAVCC